MTLRSELDAFRRGWQDRARPAVAATVAAEAQALRAGGILSGISGPGARIADPGTLRDLRGRPADLAGLLSRPAIVTVYRGGWCPYCNIELRAFQRLLPRIEARGAALIAVSPERPACAMETAEKNALSFPVLSDPGGVLAASLGLRVTLSEAMRALYRKAGHPLPERNGDGSWSLPVPATFAMAPGGRIAAAFAHADYRRRAEPEAALAALPRR